MLGFKRENTSSSKRILIFLLCECSSTGTVTDEKVLNPNLFVILGRHPCVISYIGAFLGLLLSV